MNDPARAAALAVVMDVWKAEEPGTDAPLATSRWHLAGRTDDDECDAFEARARAR
ncbi:MAG: hypothetical protein ABI346_05110 [Candidatus Baltobacteraceae bacterium]